MKVVHIVTSDSGGAARAAIRINQSINNSKNGSSIIVGKKSKSNYSIKTVSNHKLMRVSIGCKNFINHLTIKRFNTSTLFSNAMMGIDISHLNEINDCDIINLHWINEGMLSYNSLKKLKKLNKPIVWTLHDMWPFTGGCHYDEECGRFRNNCGQCRVLGSNKIKDISTKLQKKKAKIYNNMNLTIVGCSNWITNCAKESSLLRDKYCVNIPNAIDTNVFKVIDKKKAREILNISTEKRIILFGAMSSTSDKRKGFKYLLEAAKKLDKNKYIAVIFGNNSEDSEIENYLETIYIGQLFDDFSLMLLYNSADIFIAPSEQENLANTVMESLSCGTPVVAFNIGGMPDMIQHKYNGFIAEAFSIENLVNGIEFCAENNKHLGQNARKFVLENYTTNIVANRYLDLYNTLLK